MDKPELQPQQPLPAQVTPPQKPVVAAQPTPPKPNKNVSVPKYDLLTEGYDPEKLKSR
jgi:hypothetical protein